MSPRKVARQLRLLRDVPLICPECCRKYDCPWLLWAVNRDDGYPQCVDCLSLSDDGVPLIPDPFRGGA